jgi:hypothetical protein
MRANVDRNKVLLILDWCIFKFGASRYSDEFPPKIRIYKSKGTDLRGTYLDGVITVYLASNRSVKELCETVIHEYKHYLMNDDEYDVLANIMKKRGRDKEYMKYNHPHEKRARRMENKWGEICFNELRNKLYKK